MTKEEIIELAKEYFSSIEYDSGNVHECYEFSFKEIVAFAKLVAEKEREECAQEVEGYMKQRTHDTWYKAEEQIRARGQE